MHLIKVSAINSTNSFAREMFKDKPQMPITCIVAKKQLQGRGQRGTHWDAEEGKNLTFSIFLPRPDMSPINQFLLSASVATSLLDSLEKFNLPRLKIKWPNDILSANQKIAGILIENIISDGRIVGSIIGIGLNVNQERFDDLPQAGSMKTMSGRHHDLEHVLDTLLQNFEMELKKFSDRNSEAILKAYKNRLFRREIPSTFQWPDGKLFTGMITNVTRTGKLLVQTDDEAITEFDLKEVKLLY